MSRHLHSPAARRNNQISSIASTSVNIQFAPTKDRLMVENTTYDISINCCSQQLSDLINEQSHQDFRNRHIIEYEGGILTGSLKQLLESTGRNAEIALKLKYRVWRYGVGEIYHSPRVDLGRSKYAYHHAYLITEVDDGRVVEFIDFDPHETLSSPPSSEQLICGVRAKPRCSRDSDLINTIFADTTLKPSSKELIDPTKIAAMNARKDKVKDIELTYSLPHFNCQHFATYVRNGDPISSEVNALGRSAVKSVQLAVTDGQNFWKTVSPALSWRPFSNNSTLGQIGNAAASLTVFIVLLLLLMFFCFISFGIHLMGNYLEEREEYVEDEDNDQGGAD